MYLRIDHVAIAVRSIGGALRVYAEGLGLVVSSIEEVPAQKTRVALLPVGESRIELLEATAEDSPVAAFLAKRGEGLHHICFEVENLDAALIKIRAAGMRVIDPAQRAGAGGSLIAFIHPSSAAGVLIELSQPRSKSASDSNSE